MTPRTFAYGLAAILLAALLTPWGDPAAARLVQACLLALASAYAALAVFSKLPLKAPWPALAVAAPALIGTAQLLLGRTAYAHATWDGVTTWLARAAALLLAASAFDRRTGARLRNSLVAFAAAMSLFGIVEWFTSGARIAWLLPVPGVEAVIGTFPNRDHYAAFIELTLPVALWRVLTASRPSPWTTAAAGVMFASVIVCASRAGIVIVTLEALTLIALALWKRQTSLRTIVPVLAVITLCTALGGGPYALARLRTPDSVAFRKQLLVATAAMIRERPLSGFGLGTWPTVYPAYAVFDPPGLYMNHAHNDWAEWTAEGGFLLLASLLLLAFAAVRAALRKPWCAGVAGVLLHSLVDFPMQKTAVALLAMTLLGAAFAGDDRRTPEAP